MLLAPLPRLKPSCSDKTGLNVRLRMDGLTGLEQEMLAGGIGAAA
jgi:hypothetical protein